MDSSGSFELRDDSHLNINWTNPFSYLRKIHSKYQRTDDAGYPTYNESIGRANPGCQ